MKNTENTNENPTPTKEHDEKLSRAIMLAIELSSSFKLYSYRIISPEQYQERVKELIMFYNSKK